MRPQTRRAQGFTLLEILIVALLIGLLSAIGLISVRTFMDRNRLRIVAGETYQLASALSFARDDLGFIPKLNFLTDPLNNIGVTAGAIEVGTNPINPDFEYFGNDITALTPRIGTEWQGPYMGMSQSRGSVGSGPSIVGMQMPQNNDTEERYPGDAWGQPYVVYRVSIDENGNIFFDAGGGAVGIGTYTDTPNYFSAVVSYGPNQVPGGDEPPASSGLAGGTPADTRANQEAARLYEVISTRNPLVYRALLPADYNTLERRGGVFAVQDQASTDDLIRQF